MIRNHRSFENTGAFALIGAYAGRTAKPGGGSLFTDTGDLRLAPAPNAQARVMEFRLPGLTLGFVQSTGHSVAVSESDSFTILLPVRGLIRSRTRKGEFAGTQGSVLTFPPDRRETKVEPDAQRVFEALVLVRPKKRLLHAATSQDLRDADDLNTLPPRTFGSAEGAAAGALRQLACLLAADVSARALSILTEEGLASWEHLLLSKTVELLLEGRSPQSRSGSRRQLVDRAMAHIQANYAGIHTIVDVAVACDVSIRTLEMAFQGELNQTPSEALKNRRLDEARRMIMRHRDLGVTEIALACGFNHLGRFSGAFRSRFGTAPSEVRAKAEASTIDLTSSYFG